MVKIFPPDLHASHPHPCCANSGPRVCVALWLSGKDKGPQRLADRVWLLDFALCSFWVPDATILSSLPVNLGGGATFWAELIWRIRSQWPSRIWPWTSPRWNGSCWMVLRGSSTEMWCWRPAGTWPHWVGTALFIPMLCRSHLLSIYCVPRAMLGSGDLLLSKTVMVLPMWVHGLLVSPTQ